jgi:hypothetical protein
VGDVALVELLKHFVYKCPRDFVVDFSLQNKAERPGLFDGHQRIQLGAAAAAGERRRVLLLLVVISLGAAAASFR